MSSIGSHCDNNAGNISGWVLRYDASTLKLTGKFNTIEASAGYELSSIWMAGYSPAIDPAAMSTPSPATAITISAAGMKGYGESVIALSPDLKKKPVGTFTPSNWQILNNGDTDFGSGGAMLIPVSSGQTAPPMIIGMGKAGTAYLLDASHLDGLEGHNGYQALQKIQIGGGCWCGPAYYGGPSGGIVYYQGGGDVLRAYSVETGERRSSTQIATSTTGAGYGGSFPVVSSNGNTANTGGRVADPSAATRPSSWRPTTRVSLGAPLFAANAGSWSTAAAPSSRRWSPTAASMSGLPDGDGVRPDGLIPRPTVTRYGFRVRRDTL